MRPKIFSLHVSKYANFSLNSTSLISEESTSKEFQGFLTLKLFITHM